MAKTKKMSKKKTEMSSMIAHELRSPIGSIRAAAALLADGSYGKLPSKAKEIALLIQNAADRLLSQTEGYLQVMQLSDGSFEVQAEPYDAEDLIKKIVHEWKPQAKLKKLDLIYNCKNFPPTLNLDQSVLTHIVYNLLDNAIKYTESGYVSIDATWKNDEIEIVVKDTGQGMARSTVTELFKHPIKRKKKTKSISHGMGLGLYIVSELLKASKGNITAHSKGKDQGSTFIVHLPAQKVDSKNTNR